MKLARAEQIVVSEEEMQRLAFDNRPIRRYCLQCRGPKLMMPAKKDPAHGSDLIDTKAPPKYSIVCKTCGMKYTAKLGSE